MGVSFNIRTIPAPRSMLDSRYGARKSLASRQRTAHCWTMVGNYGFMSSVPGQHSDAARPPCADVRDCTHAEAKSARLPVPPPYCALSSASLRWSQASTSEHKTIRQTFPGLLGNERLHAGKVLQHVDILEGVLKA